MENQKDAREQTAIMTASARYALLFLVFADLVGFGMLIPDVQLRAERLGAHGWLIGAVLSSMFVVQAVASPIWGSVSDRLGRKPVVLACTSLSVLSMLVYSQASTVWVILAARIIAGLGAANVAAARAALADSSTPERRTALMGQVGAATSAGLILGPALGGLLSAKGGALLVGGVAGSCSLLGLLAFAFLVPNVSPRASEKEERSGALGLLSANRVLLTLFLVATVGWFALACLEGTFGRLVERTVGQGALLFGLIFAYESVLAVGIQSLVVGRAQKLLGDRSLLVLAFILQGAGLASMPFARSVPLLFAASTVYAVGNGLMGPSINGWCSRVTPERQQGVMFGALQSARSLGFMIGPSLGGALFDVRISYPYLLAGGVSLIAAGCVSALVIDRRSATAESGSVEPNKR